MSNRMTHQQHKSLGSFPAVRWQLAVITGEIPAQFDTAPVCITVVVNDIVDTYSNGRYRFTFDTVSGLIFRRYCTNCSLPFDHLVGFLYGSMRYIFRSGNVCSIYYT